MQVLDVRVDEIKRGETIDKITEWIKGKGNLRQIVTLYSEFLLAAQKDKEFKEVLVSADLVVPDGMAVLAAMEYSKDPGLVEGLRLGFKGLSGKLGEPVTGVWLFEKLVGMAVKNNWKVFLLGGFEDTARRLTDKVRKSHPGIEVEFDAGEQKVGEDEKKNERVVEKINLFKPDLLMVAYGPVTQEKWIYKNKKRLKVRVAIGLGGTFDEVLGRFPKAPKWMEKRGLKALWRLMVQPKRFSRIFRAMVIFPLEVFRRS